MKRLYSILILSIFIVACEKTILYKGTQPIYLSHNLWFGNPEYIESINFKEQAAMLPAGTQVNEASVTIRFISFNVDGISKKFNIFVNQKYQQGSLSKLNTEKLFNRTFSTSSFEELTAGLKPEEIENIKHGTIQKGMSKQAVIVSWGYPPLHKTPSLDESEWYYWRKRVVKIRVTFDKNDRVLNSTWYGNGGNAVDVIE